MQLVAYALIAIAIAGLLFAFAKYFHELRTDPAAMGFGRLDMLIIPWLLVAGGGTWLLTSVWGAALSVVVVGFIALKLIAIPLAGWLFR